MKNRLMYLLMLSAVIFTVSCSTKSDPTPTPASYKFTINGDNYTEVSGADSTTNFNGSTYNTLGITGQSADKSAQAGLVIFWTAKPKAGTYTTVDDVTKLGDGKVAILIIEKVSTAKNGLFGTAAGSSLTVAISSAGKVSVNMPSVAITGTNFDNTDPKNSVATTVTGAMSGTVSE